MQRSFHARFADADDCLGLYNDAASGGGNYSVVDQDIAVFIQVIDGQQIGRRPCSNANCVVIQVRRGPRSGHTNRDLRHAGHQSEQALSDTFVVSFQRG
jgi:hypothetical protein